MELTKAEINKLLVEERKKSRIKQKQSAFMNKSRTVYNGMLKRAQGLNKTVPFDLAQFREWLKTFVDANCRCGKKMTLKQIAIDHRTPVSRGGSFELSNCSPICTACNWHKGILLEIEFVRFQDWVNSNLSPESREDLYRRLTIGGKFSFK